VTVQVLPGCDDLQRFRRIAAQQLGLQFDDTKAAFLGEVVNRRLDASGLASSAYLTNLEAGRWTSELTALARELTVGETYFFRNIDQFHACAEIVLPERMAARSAGRRLHFLSAGCATGEEAFSLAIMARRANSDSSWTVAIRAVDINAEALDKAARGRFTKWALRETPAEIQRDYFRQEGGQVVLDEAIRRAVSFEQRNLAVDDPALWWPSMYDLVFCRNVLMYFAPEQAEALVARITRSLAPGGFLFLGHAETLRGLSQQFHLCHTHGTFYYQYKEESEPARRGFQALTSGSWSSEPTAALDIVDSADSWVSAIERAAARVRELSARTEAVDGGSPAARREGQRATAPAKATREAAPRPRADLSLALDLFKAERFSEALDIVHRSSAGAEDDSYVLLLRALLLAHSHQLAAAEQTCRRLLAIDELHAGAHYVLALCREGVADRVGAAEHDQTASYLDPSFAMPRLHLGLLARRAGDRDTARRELGEAMLLLQREDASRILFFGGGFNREALIALCRAELAVCGGRS
jgi:chemotaxis protein methyltransferase CheR